VICEVFELDQDTGEGFVRRGNAPLIKINVAVSRNVMDLAARGGPSWSHRALTESRVEGTRDLKPIAARVSSRRGGSAICGLK
jgi:hypothetical protein